MQMIMDMHMGFHSLDDITVITAGGMESIPISGQVAQGWFSLSFRCRFLHVSLLTFWTITAPSFDEQIF